MKNISSNKNHIQISQENSQLRSKNFHLSNEIISFEGQIKDLKRQLESKNRLIESQGKEIDDWQRKATEIEQSSLAKLQEAQNELNRLRNEKSAEVSPPNTVAKSENNKQNNDEKENLKTQTEKNCNDAVEMSQEKENKPQDIVKDSSTKDGPLNIAKILGSDKKLTNCQYKETLWTISNQYLQNEKKLIAQFEERFDDLISLRPISIKDDMNVIYARKVEANLIDHINEKLKQDKLLIQLQDEKLTLEKHMADCNESWYQQEVQLKQKIQSLENSLRKYSKVSSGVKDESDSCKIVYLRTLLMQLLLTKDWDIKIGMLNALQKLLDLSNEEMHTLRHSL